MINRAVKKSLLTLSMLLCAAVAQAQYTSGSYFSPYTFYGLGEMNTPGTAINKSMGGIGVAERTVLNTSSLNPAGYSAALPKSFLLSVSVMNVNNYLSSSTRGNSKNSTNLNDISLRFRVARRIGFGFSLSPFSNVGYAIKWVETDPAIIANVGNMSAIYSGNGGVSQLKAGLGMEVFRNFSVGVNYIYYLGTITREFETVIYPYITNEVYKQTAGKQTITVNQSGVEIGAQYQIGLKENKDLILGMTYRPRIKTYSATENIIQNVTSGYAGTADSLQYSKGSQKMILPTKIAAGIFYRGLKTNIGLDYSFENWKNSFPDHTEQSITFTNQQDIRLGIQYTPNRYDLRKQLKRWSYRAGLHYGTSYVVKDNYRRNDYSFTFGVGVPVQKKGFSELNVGVEFGINGIKSDTQIQNKYFKVVAGFSLFSDNEWFRQKRFE